MALPLSITVIFGISHVPDAVGVMQHTLKNPNAPSALTYAWIGPFIGALVRPVGGWMSDKIGGSIVTQAISAVMVIASVAVGYVMLLAYGSSTPEQYFMPFMVLGWTSAIAAYGAFIAPVVIGAQIKAGTPQIAMYGFAIFYALCLVLNWWFYLRADAEIRNP
jgi:NNP family nitrate/nitrite transporter-like MFS transporter